jgi:hypothetical protein
MISDRGMETEAQILEVIQDLATSSSESRLSMKEIASLFIDRHGEEYERKVSPKWVGHLIRKKLNLKPQKSHGVFVIPPSEGPKLARLYERYGISRIEEPEASGPVSGIEPLPFG